MAWLISRALMLDYENSRCSLALAAGYSADCCSDGEPSAPLNPTPTPRAYCSPGKTTEYSRLSRFGMTCAVLTDDRGEDLLTWFRVASRARTSALQERAQESTASAADCGGRWRASLARFDPGTRSWRTVQPSLLGDSDECSVIWPRSGMTAAGRCWELPTLAHRTAANDAGLWPTPNVPNGGRSCAHVTDWRGTDGRTAYHNGKKVQVGLEHAAKHWPTPTVSGNHNRKGLSKSSGDGLSTAVKTWPTPTVNDSKNCTLPPSQTKRDNIPGALLRDGENAGGALNPTWVEWLMGWPMGWTSLEPMPNEHAEFWKKSTAGMWWGHDPSTPPQEHSDSSVPRAAAGVPARVARLKAIGNGQVPLCAAEAWRLLTHSTAPLSAAKSK